MRAIDLCCGAGGLSRGLIDTGMDVILGLDYWDEARLVYRQNVRRPTMCWNLLRAIPDLPAVDLIVGGPPCQDYSRQGQMQEGERAKVTIRWAETVVNHRPHIFAMENVDNAGSCGTYQEARRLLGQHYGLTSVKLTASYYGVPQARTRLLLVGVLGGTDDAMRTRLTRGGSDRPLTVRDYCRGRLNLEYYYRHYRHNGGWQKRAPPRTIWSIDEPAPTVTTCWATRVPRVYQPRPGDRTTDMRRVRSLTLWEASMIQGMGDWDWCGVREDVAWQLLANAVPPPLAQHLGRVLRVALVSRSDSSRMGSATG